MCSGCCRTSSARTAGSWPSGPATSDRGPMQRLPRYARWDADAVRDDLRAYAVEHLGTDDAVLIVDETGFVKKGHASAGVRRQYTGTAGRIENSQVGVVLALATGRGRALIDRRLYLPEYSWCTDAERRHTAGIPEEVQFATKPRLASKMIDAALDAASPPPGRPATKPTARTRISVPPWRHAAPATCWPSHARRWCGSTMAAPLSADTVAVRPTHDGTCPSPRRAPRGELEQSL